MATGADAAVRALARRLAVARGDAAADLVLRGGGCSTSMAAGCCARTSRWPTGGRRVAGT
jgi:hypothetical protein